jgi:EF-hand domain pair
MLLALGAVSSAMDALQSLTSSKTSSPHSTGFRHSSAKPFELASSSAPGSQPQAAAPRGFSQLSPETMNALLAAQGQASSDSGGPPTASRSGALNHLFSTLDADGSGCIDKTEFEEALGAGGTNTANAKDVFGRLDKDGDGSVSLGELVSALRGGKRPHHHPPAAGESNDANASNSSDPLLQALSGASSTSISNGDGSTTTSVTYADGSKVTMISPAAKTASIGATSSYNFIEQMIAREAQAIASGASTSLSLKV